MAREAGVLCATSACGQVPVSSLDSTVRSADVRAFRWCRRRDRLSALRPQRAQEESGDRKAR
eukprot:3870615-Pleurochrysis_carterae.AAC.1